MVKEVSYIRLAIHQLKDILTQRKGNCKVNIYLIFFPYLTHPEDTNTRPSYILFLQDMRGRLFTQWEQDCHPGIAIYSP